MSPATFDILVKKLSKKLVFQNNSWAAEQIFVEQQVLIALQRFEMFGNGASMHLIMVT